VTRAALALALLLVACGPRKPAAPPEPEAKPAPVEISWPDAGVSSVPPS
jgi:hypothetical protein